MKHKYYFISLLVFFACTANMCIKEDENCHKTINFVNNSKYALYLGDSPYHPDTLFLTDFSSIVSQDKIYKVNSGETNRSALVSYRSCLEGWFKPRHPHGLDTFIIFIFDANVVENTPWNIVDKDYLILQRYDVSLEDLQHLSWTLSYPPSEAMKDMKMYPPYEK
ncbi:MAG: hypothetical protein LBT50_00710 [Prevotellaceae bacterium]|jgi:hypothetical protein|nr:hypothetical protein [Prevotellaceae bacterium]